MTEQMTNIFISKDILRKMDKVKLSGEDSFLTIFIQDNEVYLIHENGCIREAETYEKLEISDITGFYNSFLKNCPRLVKIRKFNPIDRYSEYLAEPVKDLDSEEKLRHCGLWIKGNYLFRTKTVDRYSEWRHTEDKRKERVVCSFSKMFSKEWKIDLPGEEEIELFDLNREAL